MDVPAGAAFARCPAEVVEVGRERVDHAARDCPETTRRTGPRRSPRRAIRHGRTAGCACSRCVADRASSTAAATAMANRGITQVSLLACIMPIAQAQHSDQASRRRGAAVDSRHAAVSRIPATARLDSYRRANRHRATIAPKVKQTSSISWM